MKPVRPLGSHAPGLRRTRCPHCYEPVDRVFEDETGLDRDLEAFPCPIDYDLTVPAHRRRIWRYDGRYVGWQRVNFPRRDWRELRRTHYCATE